MIRHFFVWLFRGLMTVYVVVGPVAAANAEVRESQFNVDAFLPINQGTVDELQASTENCPSRLSRSMIQLMSFGINHPDWRLYDDTTEAKKAFVDNDDCLFSGPHPFFVVRTSVGDYLIGGEAIVRWDEITEQQQHEIMKYYE